MRKKNRHLKIIFRLFIAAVAIMLVGLGGYRLKKIAPETVLVTYHHVYSDKLKQELAQFVEAQVNSIDFSGFDPDFLVKNIKNKFTFVKKVFWHWDASGRAMVTVEGVKPLFLVNNQFVLGNKKRLFPVDLFRDVSLDSLRPLTIASVLIKEQKVSSLLYKFLQTIPDLYWDRYSVSCLGDHFVLSDAKSRLRLIVDEDVLMDQRKMDVVQGVTKKYVTYDLRFKNCVCERYVGGFYGKKNAR